MDLDKIANEIRSLPLMTDLLTPAARSGFICPDCGNGTGDNGTGAVEKDNRLICGKCNKVFSNVDICAAHLRISTTGNDFVEVLKFAAERAGINFDSGSNYTAIPPKKQVSMPVKKEKSATQIAQIQKELELIKQDIQDAREHLKELPLDENGQWRGLTIETLKLFKCGYLPNWKSPTSRIADKFQTPTPRAIIPAGEHYLARLTVPIETFDEKTRQYIKPKQHAGTMRTFGLQTLNAKTYVVYVFEGEIDVMSAWQCLCDDNDFGFIANLGASHTFWLNDLDAVFGGLEKKPLIVIVGDNDGTGKTYSEKHRTELLRRGYPATVEFFSNGDEKIDANDVLTGKSGLTTENGATEGNVVLTYFLLKFLRRAEDNRPALESEIARIQAENETANEEKKQQELQRRIDAAFSISGTSDLANARRLAILHGDNFRYIQDLDCWAIYKDSVWKVDYSGKSSILLPAVVDTADKLAQNAHSKNDDAVAERFTKNRYISAAISMLKGIESIIIQQSDLDKHSNLLNCKNGVVDLETGKIYNAAPELLLTQKTCANYRSGYSNSTVEKFLQDIQPDDEDRRALLRFLGYGLTAEAKEEKFLFIDGRGGNGKGTLTGLLMRLFGNYATTIPAKGLMIGKSADPNNATPILSSLIGKRLAMAEELPPNVKLDTALIKNLTGGDKLYFRRLHHEAETFDAVHKLILSGNNLPELIDSRDNGFQRRLLRIEFTQDFRNCADLTLKDRLATQDSLDSFLSILVAAARDWYKYGLIVTEAMKNAAEEYLNENDFLSEFISTYCNLDAEGRIGRQNFTSKLRATYADATAKLSDRSLSEMFKKIPGVEYGRKAGAYWLFGIAWKEEKASEEEEQS